MLSLVSCDKQCGLVGFPAKKTMSVIFPLKKHTSAVFLLDFMAPIGENGIDMTLTYTALRL
jgi:hypothetical protein